jgi:hypothetical protein
MATNRQKEAARRNITKARQAQSARAHGKSVPRQGEGISTAEENRLDRNRLFRPGGRSMPNGR